MIINVRGTNGSGKSTVVREVMALSDPPARPIYGALGSCTPEAYELRLPGAARPVFVLGPYLTATGGCDAVHPFDLILELLEKYAPRGHVLFEGSLVSDHYGRIGAFLEQRGEDALVAFMPTSLEECLRRVGVRRAGRGNAKELNPANTQRRYDGIQKVRTKIEAEGKMRSVVLPEVGASRVVVEVMK